MRFRLVCSLLCLLVSAGPVAAQSTTGTISGRVVDMTGGALPGVSVTARSAALQGARETVTSGNGDYILTLLPSGTYDVVFELSGFQPYRRSISVAPRRPSPWR